MKKWGDLLPHGIAPVGFEAMYTGQTAPSSESDEYRDCRVDAEGTPYVLYSLWGFAHIKEENWNDEIRLLNSMQQELPQLSDDVRRIRQQIASLVCCDSGVPVTIDEILNAMGTGRLPGHPFHAGCWMSLGVRSTQPEHIQSMRTIDAIIRGHVDGIPRLPDAFGTLLPSNRRPASIDGAGATKTCLPKPKRQASVFASGWIENWDDRHSDLVERQASSDSKCSPLHQTRFAPGCWNPMSGQPGARFLRSSNVSTTPMAT